MEVTPPLHTRGFRITAEGLMDSMLKLRQIAEQKLRTLTVLVKSNRTKSFDA